jgi:peroxiredoxin
MTPARFALALAAFAVGLLAFSFLSDGGKDYLEPGDRAPAFSLADTAGRLRASNEWADQVLVLNFWATWCPPCRREIPALLDIQRELGPRGLTIIGIALDEAPAVEAFAREIGIDYPLLVGEQDVVDLGRRLGNHYAALPFTVVVDRKGVITHAQAGEITRESLTSRVLGLL